MEYRKKEETLLLAMSEVESFHDVVEDEVHFREDVPRVESPTPPTPITSNDMDVIIKGWEIKFEQISRCLREVQFLPIYGHIIILCPLLFSKLYGCKVYFTTFRQS